MMITVDCRCPLCGKISSVTCDKDAYQEYISTRTPIQEIFPDMELSTREMLISGMCLPCQEAFFVEDDEDCDGECDVCLDFDCPSNASYFAPQEE